MNQNKKKFSLLSLNKQIGEEEEGLSDAAAGWFPAMAPPRRSSTLIFFKFFFISISYSPSPLFISGLRFCKYPTKNPRSKFKVTTFLSKKERKNEEKREREHHLLVLIRPVLGENMWNPVRLCCLCVESSFVYAWNGFGFVLL